MGEIDPFCFVRPVMVAWQDCTKLFAFHSKHFWVRLFFRLLPSQFVSKSLRNFPFASSDQKAADINPSLQSCYLTSAARNHSRETFDAYNNWLLSIAIDVSEFSYLRPNVGIHLTRSQIEIRTRAFFNVWLIKHAWKLMQEMKWRSGTTILCSDVMNNTWMLITAGD